MDISNVKFYDSGYDINNDETNIAILPNGEVFKVDAWGVWIKMFPIPSPSMGSVWVEGFPYLNTKTSAQWHEKYKKEYKLEIIDEDGWDRKNFIYSWHVEEITWEEFLLRAGRSTMQGV